MYSDPHRGQATTTTTATEVVQWPFLSLNIHTLAPGTPPLLLRLLMLHNNRPTTLLCSSKQSRVFLSSFSPFLAIIESSLGLVYRGAWLATFPAPLVAALRIAIQTPVAALCTLEWMNSLLWSVVCAWRTKSQCWMAVVVVEKRATRAKNFSLLWRDGVMQSECIKTRNFFL